MQKHRIKLPRHWKLAFLVFIQWFVLTIGIRAVAQANFLYILITDLIAAWMQFTIIKQIQEATTTKQKVFYIIGAAAGTQIATLVSLWLLGK